MSSKPADTSHSDIMAYLADLRESIMEHRSHALQLWEACGPDKGDGTRIALGQFTQKILEGGVDAAYS